MKKSKILIIKILVVCMMFQMHLVGYATENTSQDANQGTATAETTGETTETVVLPEIRGEAAIVMNIDTKEVLYEKNPDTQLYPASITKILTTMIALENSQMTDRVVASQACVDSLIPDATQIYLAPGEDISMQDALYATMLASANEAAYAVAESTTGDYSQFIQMMNDKAKEVGAVNSNFVNSSGLHDDNHYTTARDMALIASEAYQNTTFGEIIIAPSYVIQPTNISENSRTLNQRHQTVLESSEYYYEYSLSGKSGFTTPAGNTLVTYAQQGDMRIVAVVMKSVTGTIYEDTVSLLKYAFDQYHEIPYTAIAGGTDIAAYDNTAAAITLPKTIQATDLQFNIVDYGNADDKKGVVEILHGTEVITTETVTISDAYYQKIAEEEARIQAIKEEQARDALIKKILTYVGVGALIVILVLAFIIGGIRKRNRERRKRRHERRRRYQAQKRKRR